MSKLKAYIQVGVLFFILALPLSLLGEEDSCHPSPFVLITVPKSGSHMILKALYLITGTTALWHADFIPLNLSDQQFLYTHFCVSSSLEEGYAQIPRMKTIINIRDLRDVCISMVYHIHESLWPGMSAEQREVFKTLSFDEQLLFVINYDYDVDEVAEFAPDSLQVSIIKIAEQLEKYCQRSDYLICRYEDLVGPKGGGTEEAQIKEIKRIANHLDLNLSELLLEEIASKLYGNEFDPFGKKGFEDFASTFRQGKIHAWKQLFKEQHIRAFKRKMNKTLIALGYETKEDW